MGLHQVTNAIVGSLQAFYRARILTVEIVMFFFMLGRWLYIPLCEQYYYHRFGSDILRNTSFDFPNGSFCVSSELINNNTGSNDSYKVVESQSNHLVAYAQLANTIPAVLVTIILGPLTDKYGRKMGIILPVTGIILQGLLSVFIAQYSLHPYYFILANFIGGIFGSTTSFFASCYSYIADISSPRWRSLRIGIILSFHSFGGSIGTLIGGYWLYNVNCKFVAILCFFVACNFFVLVYTVFLIPESLSRSEREKLSSNTPKGIKSYVQGFKLLCGRLSLCSTWKLYVIIFAANIELFNLYGSIIIDVYFLKALPFDFNPLQIGVYQAVKAFTEGLATLLLMLVLVALKVGDVWIVLVALIGHATSNLLQGFATQSWQIYAIAALKGIEGLTWPGGRGLMSKLVMPEQLGTLFSIVAATQSVAFLSASLVWPVVFPLTLQHNMRSGMTYIFMAALGFLTLPFILSLLPLKMETPTVREEGSAAKTVEERVTESSPLLKDKKDNQSYL